MYNPYVSYDPAYGWIPYMCTTYLGQLETACDHRVHPVLYPGAYSPGSDSSADTMYSQLADPAASFGAPPATPVQLTGSFGAPIATPVQLTAVHHNMPLPSRSNEEGRDHGTVPSALSGIIHAWELLSESIRTDFRDSQNKELADHDRLLGFNERNREKVLRNCSRVDKYLTGHGPPAVERALGALRFVHGRLRTLQGAPVHSERIKDNVSACETFINDLCKCIEAPLTFPATKPAE